MKKIFGLVLSFVFIALVAVSIISCGKAESFSSFEEGRALAEKSNKGILLTFCSDSDEISGKLMENGFGNEAFLKKYAKDFVFVTLDFSDRLDAENLNPTATEEERANAQKIIEETEASMKVAESYVIRSLPTTLLLTKEGYVVCPLELFKVREDFNPDSENAANPTVDEVFELYDYTGICQKTDEALVLLKDFQNNLKIANKDGSVQDRVAAIDEVFDSTDFQYRYLIHSLNELAIQLDSENTTGSMAKHVMASVAAQAVEAGENFKLAAEIFASGAEREFLTGDDRQLLYYRAAQASFRLGKEGFAAANDYLHKSIDAAPQSEQVELLNMMIEQIAAMNLNQEQ